MEACRQDYFTTVGALFYFCTGGSFSDTGLTTIYAGTSEQSDLSKLTVNELKEWQWIFLEVEVTSTDSNESWSVYGLESPS